MQPFLRRRIAVFGLMMLGKDDDEISRILGISRNVVQRDVHHILVAFDATKRTRVVEIATAKGLVVFHKVGLDIQMGRLHQILNPLVDRSSASR